MQIALLIYLAIVTTLILVLQVMNGSENNHYYGTEIIEKDIEENKKKMNHGIPFNPKDWVMPKEKKRGMIILPKTDLEEAREKIIEENAAQGKDTKLSDLYPE